MKQRLQATGRLFALCLGTLCLVEARTAHKDGDKVTLFANKVGPFSNPRQVFVEARSADRLHLARHMRSRLHFPQTFISERRGGYFLLSIECCSLLQRDIPVLRPALLPACRWPQAQARDPWRGTPPPFCLKLEVSCTTVHRVLRKVVVAVSSLQKYTAGQQRMNY